MSTPGASAPSAIKDERKKSLGKYVKRMSSVFKREKSSKSTPSIPATPSTPTLKVGEKETTPAAPTDTPATAPATTPAALVTQELSRAALQQERARALFAKYGLKLEAHEWISPAAAPVSVQRVEKPIRMRVHRSCHLCGCTFGADRVCAKCEHKRCKECPRYPKKKTPGEKGKQKEAVETPMKKKKLLTVTTRAGEERVYSPIKQRVRRTCHKCNAFFVPPTATTCVQCQHTRCTKCPREPAKLNKWPHGYPGDIEPDSEIEVERDYARRIWRKPRQRVRWECEECHANFIEGSPLCPGCGHERCEKCARIPLKKSKKEKEFDPAVIRAVEEKLRALAVDDEPPAPSAEAT